MRRETIRGLLRFVAAPLAGLAALAGVPRAAGPLAIVNETPSIPRGLYVRTPGPLAHGAVVAFAPPRRARATLAALGYPGDVWLLKRVAARPGEAVTVAALPRLRTDRRGAPLPQAPDTLTLSDGEMFVLGDTGAQSFDSRYFGPVRITDVLGAYRLVWSW